MICKICNVAYAEHIKIQKILPKVKPNRIIIELSTKQYTRNEKKKKEQKHVLRDSTNDKKDNIGFKWPSSIVNKPKNASENKIDLKQESELHSLGYKITGLNRSLRWDILKNVAIPRLGLEQVVKQIARNIRLRKLQVNGQEKFKYAIQEWEYDLDMLKRNFYLGNFNWPNS